VQPKDFSGGLDPAIIRLVLNKPNMPSDKIMSALRRQRLPAATRLYVQHVRRIVRLVLDEQARAAKEGQTTTGDDTDASPTA
jgi:hypothetical protein